MASTDDLQRLHRELGSLAAARAPEDWAALRIRAEIHSDNSLIEARYTPSTFDAETKSFALGRDGRKVIEALNDAMAETKDGSHWKVMLFALDRSGKFNVDFEYDDPSRWNDSAYRSYEAADGR